jgi:hypothetical protein
VEAMSSIASLKSVETLPAPEPAIWIRFNFSS